MRLSRAVLLALLPLVFAAGPVAAQDPSNQSGTISLFVSYYGETGLGLGYLHTRPAGPVYLRQEDGSVGRSAISGSPHVAISADVRTGFDFSKVGLIPGGVFVGMNLIGEYPFNGFLLPHVVAQTGIFTNLQRWRQTKE